MYGEMITLEAGNEVIARTEKFSSYVSHENRKKYLVNLLGDRKSSITADISR